MSFFAALGSALVHVRIVRTYKALDDNLLLMAFAPCMTLLRFLTCLTHHNARRP